MPILVFTYISNLWFVNIFFRYTQVKQRTILFLKNSFSISQQNFICCGLFKIKVLKVTITVHFSIISLAFHFQHILRFFAGTTMVRQPARHHWPVHEQTTMSGLSSALRSQVDIHTRLTEDWINRDIDHPAPQPFDCLGGIDIFSDPAIVCLKGLSGLDNWNLIITW